MRGQSGITFLILFIAIILSTAITAGVYLTTSNKLEQRALVVGRDAEQRVSRGVEVLEVIARGNRSSGEVYGFNLLVRVLPASDALAIESIALRFASSTAGFTADVQDAAASNFQESISPTLSGDVTWIGYNVDLDGGQADTFSYGNSTSLGYPSYGGNNILVISTNDAGVQIVDTTAAGLVNDSEYHAFYNATSDRVYGYYAIDATDGKLHFASANEPCVWDTQRRDTSFCWSAINADGDRYLENDEVFEFEYRLSSPYYLSEGDSFDLDLLTSKGHIHTVDVQLPSILPFDEVTVWP